MLWVMANEPVEFVGVIQFGVYLVRFESGLKCIFKLPADPRDSSAEVFAYSLDRALDLRIVPVTDRGGFQTLALHGGVLSLSAGSVQAYIPRARPGGTSYLAHPYDDERLYLLDHLLRQSDRHSANWLWSEHNRVVAIDNALVEGVATRKSYWTALEQQPVSADLLRRLQFAVGSGAIERAHRAALSPSPLAALLARAWGLMDLGPALQIQGSKAALPDPPRVCRAYFRTRGP